MARDHWHFTGLDSDDAHEMSQIKKNFIWPVLSYHKKDEQTPRRTKYKDITMIILGIMEALCSVVCPLLTSSGKDTHLWNDLRMRNLDELWDDGKYY